jgi:hypothetical protein
LHPAVLRLLHDVIRTARMRGKPVAVCGEMAGDAAFAPLLLALGLEEFSLHPSTMLEVRRAIRDCDLAALRARGPAAERARPRRHRAVAAGRHRPQILSAGARRRSRGSQPVHCSMPNASLRDNRGGPAARGWASACASAIMRGL